MVYSADGSDLQSAYVSKRISFVMILLSLLLYFVSVPLLFPMLGGAVVGFLVIPLMVIGWHAGMKAGFLCGFTGGILVNSCMLAFLYHEWTIDVILHHQGVPGLIMLALLGGGSGYFRELRDRYIREINARKVAQKELEFSRTRTERILRTIPSAVFSVDLQQRITSWNHAAEHITGLAEADVLGKKCVDIWNCDSCRGHCGVLDEAIEKPVFGKEVDIGLPDGRTITIVKNADALYDEKGSFAGGVESFVDVTRRRQMQLELEQKNREIVDLTNTISHDLRNPLTGIRGILELHCGEAVSEHVDEKEMMLFRLALKEVDYMQELLDDLLEAARLDTGSAPIDWKPVNVAEVITKVVELYHPQISRRTIAVNLTVDGVTLYADTRAVEKVFMNLVGNAITYMGAQPHPSISVAATDDGMQVTIRIVDNGMGIPAATLPIIFDKFRRGSNVGSIKGTGLGLSIVKGIVEAHGGTVGVLSVEGGGSTFVVTIPHRNGRCVE